LGFVTRATFLVGTLLVTTALDPTHAIARATRSAVPRRDRGGGTLVYGLEAPTNGFCIPRAQLAAAGIAVAQAVYDPLVAPAADGHMVPYLARSVTPNDTYDEWTITLRRGIRFHDGSRLDAGAVKLYLDTLRTGVLGTFVFANIGAVDVVDTHQLVVRTKTPWVAFPVYLYADGRSVVPAPAQLEDDATCDTNLIGTGPFRLRRIDPVSGAVDVVRNRDYWRRSFPRLEHIKFRVQGDGTQRVTGLEAGDFDLIQGNNGQDLNAADRLKGVHVMREPSGFRTVAHLLLNAGRAPLDDVRVRRAIALAIDRPALNQIVNHGLADLADQPFDERSLGFLDRPRRTPHRPKAARRLVAAYERRHGPVRIDLQPTQDPRDQAVAAEVERELAAVGISVNLLAPVDQATLIGLALGSRVDAFMWENSPGTDPDEMRVWLHSDSLVNLNHVADRRLDRALDRGRRSTGPARRDRLYRDFSRRVVDQVYDVWGWYTTRFLAATDRVHGVIGPNLPDRHGDPGPRPRARLLGGTQQLLGLRIGG
jgi:peptide/nickel transport system substrate-binding protein